MTDKTISPLRQRMSEDIILPRPPSRGSADSRLAPSEDTLRL